MMSRTDPRKTKKVSFNIVDALITLVIILYLAYIVYAHVLGYSITNIGSERVEIEYSVMIEDVDPDYYSKIEIGDIVRTSDGTKEIGVVTSISPLARNQTITVSIRAEAYDKGGSYRVNEQKIDVGEEIYIRFLNYAPSEKVKCTEIKVI